MSIAPRTFAPSKEAVLENLYAITDRIRLGGALLTPLHTTFHPWPPRSFFFGEPAVPEKLRDYNEHHAMTCSIVGH
jgi:hypothetical protein